MANQRQKTEKGAVAVQSARDTTIGFSADDMLKIMEAQRQQIESFWAAGTEMVGQRLRDFEQKIIDRFIADQSVNRQAFADPDFQYLLFEALRAHARRGEDEMANLLVDMIAERSRVSGTNRLKFRCPRR